MLAIMYFTTAGSCSNLRSLRSSNSPAFASSTLPLSNRSGLPFGVHNLPQSTNRCNSRPVFFIMTAPKIGINGFGRM